MIYLFICSQDRYGVYLRDQEVVHNNWMTMQGTEEPETPFHGTELLFK